MKRRDDLPPSPVAATRSSRSGEPTPGKTSRAQRHYAQLPAPRATVVQAKGALSSPDAHRVAAEGVRGPAAPLPFSPEIQRLFGHHDISHVDAHIGGAATTACESLGAQAYATGSSVAFADAPDLHTAAHEAAHVVQQRAGVSLSGGVGAAGDRYEQHADAVADAVVRGESAAQLLDQVASSGPTTTAVQRRSGKRRKRNGYKKIGGGPTIEWLTRLTNAGVLDLSPRQIALLNTVSLVESSGQIAAVNSWDDQVISLGFKQVTLGHGSLQRVMQMAPGGFAKHGLVLDTSARYKQRGRWSLAPYRIAGCDTAEQLRAPEWAMKFYHASMEVDVIRALCKVAFEEIGKLDRITAKTKVDWFENDLTAQGWLLQTHNNRPAYMAKAIKRAVANGARNAATREQFLDILARAIETTYAIEEPKNELRKRKQRRKLSPAEAAALLEQLKKTYGPKGRAKAKRIVSKIPRNIELPSLTKQTQAPATGAAPAKPSPAPSPVHTPMRRVRTPFEELSILEGVSDVVAQGKAATAAKPADDPEPIRPHPPRRLSRAKLARAKRRNRYWLHKHNLEPSDYGLEDVEVDSDELADHIAERQAQLQLTVDGIAGPKTAAACGLLTKQAPADEASAPPAPTDTPQLSDVPGVGAGAAVTRWALGGIRNALPFGDPAADRARERLTEIEAFVASHTGDGNIERGEAIGAWRNELVAKLRDLRTQVEKLDDPEAKAALFREIQRITPSYSQGKNMDLLETRKSTRTCNVSALAMTLESLGKTAADYDTAMLPLVMQAARAYQHVIDASARDRVATGGDAMARLTGLRLPDFLQLAAVAEALRHTGNIHSAQKRAYKRITHHRFLVTLAGRFGVSAQKHQLTGADDTKRNRLSRKLRGFGLRHRYPVERHADLRNEMEAAERARDADPTRRNQRAFERKRAAYERSKQRNAARLDNDQAISIDGYRHAVMTQIGAKLDAGSGIFIGLANHFVRLQSLADDHVMVDDPGRWTRSDRKVTWEEARAMGYFYIYFVLA